MFPPRIGQIPPLPASSSAGPEHQMRVKISLVRSSSNSLCLGEVFLRRSICVSADIQAMAAKPQRLISESELAARTSFPRLRRWPPLNSGYAIVRRRMRLHHHHRHAQIPAQLLRVHPRFPCPAATSTIDNIKPAAPTPAPASPKIKIPLQIARIRHPYVRPAAASPEICPGHHSQPLLLISDPRPPANKSPVNQ